MPMNKGREIFTIPGDISNPLRAGPHYLIQQGAKLITEIQDITEELPKIPPNTLPINNNNNNKIIINIFIKNPAQI